MGYSFGNGSDIIDSPLSNLMDNAAIVVELVLWIPNLSLSVRRLHDENRRGWGCGLSGRGSAASARLVDYWWHCVGNGVFGSRLRVYQTRRGCCTTGLFRAGCSRIRDAAISIGGWQHYSGAIDTLNDITKDDAIDFGAAVPVEITLPQYSLIVFAATLVLNLLMLGSLVAFGSAAHTSTAMVSPISSAESASTVVGACNRCGLRCSLCWV